MKKITDFLTNRKTILIVGMGLAYCIGVAIVYYSCFSIKFIPEEDIKEDIATAIKKNITEDILNNYVDSLLEANNIEISDWSLPNKIIESKTTKDSGIVVYVEKRTLWEYISDSLSKADTFIYNKPLNLNRYGGLMLEKGALHLLANKSLIDSTQNQIFMWQDSSLTLRIMAPDISGGLSKYRIGDRNLKIKDILNFNENDSASMSLVVGEVSGNIDDIIINQKKRATFLNIVIIIGILTILGILIWHWMSSNIKRDSLQEPNSDPAKSRSDKSLEGDSHLKRIFISYANVNAEWHERLLAHLSGFERNKEIKIWSDQNIIPGTQWNQEIIDKLQASDIFILLLSADFSASNYIFQNEVPIIIQKWKEGKAQIVPILVEPCNLDVFPVMGKDKDNQPIRITDLGIIPKDYLRKPKAISLWDNSDKAFASVTAEIKRMI